MRLSDAELTSICERASTLSERSTGQYVPVGEDISSASRRLARWQELSGPDTGHQLAAMLTAFGKDPIPESGLLSALGPVTRAPGIALPPWTSFLNQIIENLAQSFDGGTKIPPRSGRSQGDQSEVPFERLYWPIADFAWSQAVSSPVRFQILASSRARRALQHYLVRRLSGISSALLQTGFLAHLAVELSPTLHHFFAKMSRGDPENADKHYSHFVTEQGRDGLRSLFLRFPVVARLIAEVTAQWIEFVGEFLDRFQCDRDHLAKNFCAGASLGPPLNIRAGMSDPHHGGRSVLILQFAGGFSLVYKPRPMEIDRIFYDLIQGMNHCSLGVDLGVLKIYDRKNYGWMEFARHRPCQDARAAGRYYRRTGALVSLVHWLQGIDFHRENVVAAGEYPLLVDLECLAHPLRPDERVHADSGESSALANSVLRSGLLPLWQPRITGSSHYDSSGFNAPIRQRSFLPVPIWQDVNTDRMRCVHRQWYQYHSAHRAKLDGRTLQIGSFEREVAKGFAEMTKRLAGTAGEQWQGFRDAIQRSLHRRVKRPTFVYAMLIRQSLDLKFLQEGVDRSIELMALPLTRTEEADWKSEIDSLENLDIPFFYHHLAGIDRKVVLDQSTTAAAAYTDQAEIVRQSVRRKARLQQGRIRSLDT